MSGTKCSDIRFHRLTALFLQAQGDRESALRDLGELLRRGKSLQAQMKKTSLKEQAVLGRLTELQTDVDAELRQMGSRQQELQAIRLSGPFERGLESKQESIANISRELRGGRGRLEAAGRHLSDLKENDAALSDLALTQRQCESLLRNHAGLLQKWNDESYRQMQHELETLTKELRQQPDSLQSVKSVQRTFAELSKKIARLVERSKEQDERDRQRRLSHLQNLQADCESLVSDMQEIVHESEAFMASLENEQVKLSGIANVYAILREILQRERDGMQAAQQKLQAIQWPSSAEDAWLRATGKTVAESRVLLAHVKGVLEESKQENRRLKELDGRIFALRSSLEELGEKIQANETLFQRWLPEEHASALAEQQRLLAELDLNEELLRSSKVDAVLEAIAQKSDALAQKLDNYSHEIQAREEKHQQRLYILKALRGVCQDLGFKEVSGPAFQQKGDYNSVVEQSFDTRTQGQISFKLSLEDAIQSESNIHIGNCRNEFAELSKLLVKKYGLETEFKIINNDGKPLDQTHDENPVPEFGELQSQVDHHA